MNFLDKFRYKYDDFNELGIQEIKNENKKFNSQILRNLLSSSVKVSESLFPKISKSIDNVLASTKKNLNEWVTVKANVKDDFKKFHNLEVNELDGLAIMSDTDNSKMKSIAYFQNIYFSTE